MGFWDDKYAEQGRIWGDEPTGAARRFLEHLPPGAKYILDVGCGYGREALFFASRGYQVTGIDPSKKAVEMAFSSVTDPSMNVEFFQDDCTRLSFPSENVDAVWSSNVLHLLEEGDRAQAVEEMTRVLKPGGVLGLYVMSTNDEEAGSHGGGAIPFHRFTREELTKLLNTLDMITLEEVEEEEAHTGEEPHHHVRWLAIGRKR